MINKLFWKNKNVLITGHSGFKGSWLSLILNLYDANLYGMSLKQKKRYSIFNLCKLEKIFKKNLFADIRNKKKLEKFINLANPEIAIHLAAQPLVINSYIDPVQTFETNVNGTINFLECCLKAKKLKNILIITSDKCYKNKHTNKGYKENDHIGGKDPYSASKACTEIIVNSYRESFFKKKGINIATARAGNVIGGGDWSDHRLFVDIIKNLYLKKDLKIRNLKSIRPWQNVLDPLAGYIKLIEKMDKNKKYSDAWNFGPENSSCITVEKLIQKIQYKFRKIKNYKTTKENFPEDKMLKLNISKSKKLLNWYPKISIDKSIKITLDWYEFMFKNVNNPNKLLNYSINQIRKYL